MQHFLAIVDEKSNLVHQTNPLKCRVMKDLTKESSHEDAVVSTEHVTGSNVRDSYDWHK